MTDTTVDLTKMNFKELDIRRASLAAELVSLDATVLDTREELNDTIREMGKHSEMYVADIYELDRAIHKTPTLLDSSGNPPPRLPRRGMVWDLEHTACDQGHYGISTWREIPIETPGAAHERHLMSDPKNVR